MAVCAASASAGLLGHVDAELEEFGMNTWRTRADSPWPFA